MSKINTNRIIKPIVWSLLFININNLLYKIYNDNVSSFKQK